MKRGDLIAAGIVLAAAVLSAAVWLLPRCSGKTVTVTQDQREVYAVPLSEDCTLTLTGNVIEIKDGRVSMHSADCKNQLCVRHAAISASGESIICLPNRVIITVE